MTRFALVALPLLAAFALPITHAAEPTGLPPVRKLTPEQSERAAANYQKYCVLCHGADRQGHVNDHAPSLRSKSLFESGIPHAVLRPIQYGRQGTAMGGYLDEAGGPMTLDETWDLTFWLFEQSGVERAALTTEPVHGDVARGGELYQKECAACHGSNGEGISAPALGNPSALAHNSDEFIRYAIQNGRDGTPMQPFKDKLSADDINSLTAFLRSRAGGWKATETVLQPLPTPDKFVLNPAGKDPSFTLKDNLYVSAADLAAALTAKQRIVLLDTRVTSVWQTAHIEGSFPLPYYSDFDTVTAALPKDVMIVAYCSCPRAAAEYVTSKLRERGYNKSAVLYEGIYGWMNLGYPVVRGAVVDKGL
ncbi:c-type cytochrome [Permianibacter fluminis]|uniref:c-type cytochrome n=1 Tax=Permianibacter fluminis TaxID=2738515 RepID=UPI001B7D762D|nr:c-type cytochrome [Permianibacter fluminis]